MSTASKTIYRIAIAIVERNGKILIAQRRPDSHLGGLWEFPGGKVHEGESPEQAVVRECREEVGIGVRVDRFFARVEHEYEDRRIELVSYICTLEEGKPSPLHCAACEWVSPAELSHFHFPEANRPILKRLTDEAL
ncbi:MAG: 8-oxo-dGTP diphosphatase MutT [Acidobacteriia bacterium]|nr:8-oxo-dGTP diphosphatase MutT [Terriglobia bacterium]